MPTIAPESPAASPPGAASEPDVVDGYIERVRTKIAALPPAQRLPFICSERTKWLVAYARFENRMQAGKQPDPGETAATYLAGILELGKLKGIEEAKAAVVPTEPNDLPDYVQDGFDPERAGTV